MRRLVHLIVVACLLWQGLGPAGPGALAAAGSDVTHAFLHWADEAHQHDGDGDGAYTRNASEDAVRHVLVDDASAAPALCGVRNGAVGTWVVPHPGEPVELAVPQPFPDRLRRPPRIPA